MSESIVAFRDAVSAFGDRLGDIHLLPSVLALVLHTASLGVRARVWRDILRYAFPSRVISTAGTFWAYVAGVGASTIAPLRSGDVVRVYAARRLVPGASIATIISTLIAETVFGLFVVVALATWAVSSGGLPPLVKLPDARAFEFSFYANHVWLVVGATIVLASLGAFALRLAEHRVRSLSRQLADGFRVLESPAGLRSPGRASAARRLDAACGDRVRDARRVRHPSVRPLCGARARRRLGSDRDPVHPRRRRDPAGASRVRACRSGEPGPDPRVLRRSAAGHHARERHPRHHRLATGLRTSPDRSTSPRGSERARKLDHAQGSCQVSRESVSIRYPQEGYGEGRCTAAKPQERRDVPRTPFPSSRRVQGCAAARRRVVLLPDPRDRECQLGPGRPGRIAITVAATGSSGRARLRRPGSPAATRRW